MACSPCEKRRREIKERLDKEKQSFTLLDSAKSLVESVVDYAVRGKDSEVTEDIFQERISLCLACPFYSGETLKICTVCKCFVYKKCRMKVASCPKKKWGEIES